MAVNTSLRSLEEMENLINASAQYIFNLNKELVDFTNEIDWSDSRGREFFKAIGDLRTKLLEPVPTLNNTKQTVQELIKVVQKYNDISF